MTQDRLERICTSTFYDPVTGCYYTIDLPVVAAMATRLKLDVEQHISLSAGLQKLKPRSLGASTKGLFPSGDQVLDHIAEIQRLADGIAKLQLDKYLHFHAVTSAFDNRDIDSIPPSSLEEDDIWDWLAQAKNIASVCKEARRHADKITHFQNVMAAPYLGQEKLIGCHLPRLYERITGMKFGISKSDNKPNAVGGVLFVMECVRALGLDAVTPNNVERHWKAAKKSSHDVLGTQTNKIV